MAAVITVSPFLTLLNAHGNTNSETSHVIKCGPGCPNGNLTEQKMFPGPLGEGSTPPLLLFPLRLAAAVVTVFSRSHLRAANKVLIISHCSINISSFGSNFCRPNCSFLIVVSVFIHRLPRCISPHYTPEDVGSLVRPPHCGLVRSRMCEFVSDLIDGRVGGGRAPPATHPTAAAGSTRLLINLW